MIFDIFENVKHPNVINISHTLYVGNVGNVGNVYKIWRFHPYDNVEYSQKFKESYTPCM